MGSFPDELEFVVHVPGVSYLAQVSLRDCLFNVFICLYKQINRLCFMCLLFMLVFHLFFRV